MTMKPKSLIAMPLLAGGAAFTGLSTGANAAPATDVIQSPTSAVINSGGPGFGSINDTLNQAGMITTFTSGVTNFNTFMGTNPLHDWLFTGNEWFSNLPTTSASVTYNMGSIVTIDALALWNEEASGIGLLDLFSSTNGTTFTPLASGLTPTDHPSAANYLANVFSFAPTSAQFIRFDMSRCPQQTTAEPFESCAIGEVAFAVGNQGSVPEPTTLALLGLGLAALGFGRRKLS